MTNELLTYSKMPRAVAGAGGNWPEPRYKVSLVACARWEARYISEWLSYHRSIGFEHVYLYCNDDDPCALYEAVLPFVINSEPFVTFIHYPIVGLQFQMYFHFARNYLHETEAFMYLDIDEFLCLRVPEGVNRFLTKFPQEMDALYINWCSFGHNNHKTRPNGSVLLNYTRRENGATPFTKVIIKSKKFPYAQFFKKNNYGIMHDYIGLDENIVAYNVLGERLTDYYKNFPTNAWHFLNEKDRRQKILDVAFIAHYNIKSDEDFDLRVKRGLGGDYAAEKMWGQKTHQQREEHHRLTNEVEDRGLHDYWQNYLSSAAWATSPFPCAKWPLISTGCDTRQSSSLHPWGPTEDSRRLINRTPVGGAQSHSDKEDAPWWQIDLGAEAIIHEIRLFNRLDTALDRMCNFSFLVSDDGEAWREFFVRQSAEIFGGIDGSPFIWQSPDGIRGRFLRIQSCSKMTYFHLDQVEVYGL